MFLLLLYFIDQVTYLPEGVCWYCSYFLLLGTGLCASLLPTQPVDEFKDIGMVFGNNGLKSVMPSLKMVIGTRLICFSTATYTPDMRGRNSGGC